MWDLISYTRDWAPVHCIGRQILNHWTTREVPPSFAYCSLWLKDAHCPFSEVQTYPFTYMVPTTAFLLQLKSWLIGTESAWPEKPKWFTIWTFPEKLHHPFIQRIMSILIFSSGRPAGWSQGDSQMLGLVTDLLLPLPCVVFGYRPCFLLSPLFVSHRVHLSPLEKSLNWKVKTIHGGKTCNTNCMCERSWNLPVQHIVILKGVLSPFRRTEKLNSQRKITTKFSSVSLLDWVGFTLLFLSQILNGCGFIPFLISYWNRSIYCRISFLNDVLVFQETF